MITKSVIIPAVRGLYRPTGLLFYELIGKWYLQIYVHNFSDLWNSIMSLMCSSAMVIFTPRAKIMASRFKCSPGKSHAICSLFSAYYIFYDTMNRTNLYVYVIWCYIYHQTSSIRCTKSQHFNVFCLVMQLSLPNPLKAGVKSRIIDLARIGNSGCANEILGCAKCHFWWKSPWKWKNQGDFRVCN